MNGNLLLITLVSVEQSKKKVMLEIPISIALSILCWSTRVSAIIGEATFSITTAPDRGIKDGGPTRDHTTPALVEEASHAASTKHENCVETLAVCREDLDMHEVLELFDCKVDWA